METKTDEKMARLLAVFQSLRSRHDEELPAQVIHCLLYIAANNPCYKSDMERALKFSTASGSRNTDWLAEKHRLGTAGLGLITKSQCTVNKKRRLVLKLTKKGELFVDSIKHTLWQQKSSEL